MTSGPGDEYTDEEINDVYDAISDAWEATSGGGGAGGGGGAAPGGGAGGGGAGGGGGGDGGGGQGAITITGSGSAHGRIRITAQVEWAGEIANNGRNGVRTVQLDGIDTRPVVAALRKARALEIRAARGPLRSYDAKSPQARLHQLTGTKAGAQALKDAGFSPSARTMRRHELGEIKTWSKANREKITEAYENIRNPGRGVQAARRQVVDALTESVKALPGQATVRFRDIRDMRIS